MKQLCSAFELLNFIYRPTRNLMYLELVRKCVYCICMSEYPVGYKHVGRNKSVRAIKVWVGNAERNAILKFDIQ